MDHSATPAKKHGYALIILFNHKLSEVLLIYLKMVLKLVLTKDELKTKKSKGSNQFPFAS